MTVKTIVGAVLAVAIGGSVLGFVSKYRADCCSNEAKSTGLSATTSKESMVSQEGECRGCCGHGDTSGGGKCCQAAALSKSMSSLAVPGPENGCIGNCAVGTSEAKECCQTAGLLNGEILQTGKGHEGECHGDCALGDSSGVKKCCQDAEKISDHLASPK